MSLKLNHEILGILANAFSLERNTFENWLHGLSVPSSSLYIVQGHFRNWLDSH